MKKKLLVVFILLSFDSTSKAQWFDLGVKGAFNSTWLLNNNYINDKYVHYEFSTGFNAGIKAGINFNDKRGITIDILFNNSKQQYSSDGLVNRSWKREINMNFIDIPLLYRNSTEGSYMEIGPQFSFPISATESFANTPSQSGDYSNVNTINHYNKTAISGVFGFGSNIADMGENCMITLGLRGVYNFTDLLSDAGGKGKEYNAITPAGTPLDTKSYKATNYLYVGLVMEISYDLGYLVHAKCRRKSKFILF
jgi:hypothetical protein